MPIMANHIIISLALLSLAVTSVLSYRRYGSYGRYGPRDESLRQDRRCPTCPADSPESLASPWYGSPAVYSQDGPYQTNNKNLAGPGVSANLYGNPYSEGSNPYENYRCPYSHGGCWKARSLRSEKISSQGHVNEDGAAIGGFDSKESRRFFKPYSYHRASPTSFVSDESYREILNTDAVGVVATDNDRLSSHYGNDNKDTIFDRKTDDEISLESNRSKFKIVSLAQQTSGDYSNPERMIINKDRLKALKTTPSNKNVFVVYRADATDDTMDDDDDLDRLLIGTSSKYQQHQQQQQQQHRNSMDSSDYEITDFQLEELVKRAIAVAKQQRRNINRDAAKLMSYDRHQPRRINYNKHESNPEKCGNSQKSYDHLYQRLNAVDPIDREEKREIYMKGLTKSSAKPDLYTPTMRYNPLYVNKYHNKIYVPSQQENAASKAQQISNTGQDIDEYKNIERGETANSEELRKINRQEKEIDQHEKDERFDTTQDYFMTTKRETDFKTLLQQPINYRTHSPITESQQVEQQQEKRSRPFENNIDRDNQTPPMSINPDLTEDMEIPPIKPSELQLSFETFDNTTPSPTN